MKKFAVLGIAILFQSQVWAAEAPKNIEIFCDQLLQPKPSLSDYSSYFTKDFRDAVPLEQLTGIFEDLYADVGKCVSFGTNLKGPGKYTLTLTSEKGVNSLFTVVVDSGTGLFSGFLVDGIQDPSVQIQNWNDVGAAFKKLDSVGKLSATLTTTDNSVHLSESPNDVFAIGSTFKLYILGTLQKAISNGNHTWDEILPLKEEWKSLPSGIMHTWPAGKEVKLSEYAEKMISISDNTATDHLLYFLGRENVESMLPAMGNAHQVFELPFLSTLEMFKLKWAIKPEETTNYIQADATARRSILDGLKQVPRSAVGTNGVSLDHPTLIDRLEWFATTEEDCNAMFWLAAQNSTQVRRVLSKSVPFLDAGQSASHWSFAGYKGGSEPGVLSMTFLLESKQGTRACLSMSWNNTTRNVSEYRFFDVVQKTLKFSETQIP